MEQPIPGAVPLAARTLIPGLLRMSTHRCPLCGAAHKQDEDHCRLCGQSLAAGSVATATQPTSIARRSTRGTKGVFLIGVGLVLAVVVTALVFDMVRENASLRQARDLVTGPADGWSIQTDDDGGFEMELPGVRTRAVIQVPGPDDGRVTAWQSTLGTDIELFAGWGQVSPPLADGARRSPVATQYLRDTVAARWMAGYGLVDEHVTMTEATVAGRPALRLQTTRSRLSVQGRDAYGHVTFILDNSTLYVLQVVTIYKDAPQLTRMARSFTLTTDTT
jgi:hypothetical protein